MTVDSLLENLPERDKDLLLKRVLEKAIETTGEIPGDEERFDYPVQNQILDEVHLASYEAERRQEAITKLCLKNPCRGKLAEMIEKAWARKAEEAKNYVLQDQLCFLLNSGIRPDDLIREACQPQEL